jgi:hypothetical protein
MKDRIRLLIKKQFDLGGFRYVEGAIVGVTAPVAAQWIAEGNAEPYDDAARTALQAIEHARNQSPAPAEGTAPAPAA